MFLQNLLRKMKAETELFWGFSHHCSALVDEVPVCNTVYTSLWPLWDPRFPHYPHTGNCVELEKCAILKIMWAYLHLKF